MPTILASLAALVSGLQTLRGDEAERMTEALVRLYDCRHSPQHSCFTGGWRKDDHPCDINPATFRRAVETHSALGADV
jgi:hypothetical protein